MLFIVWLLNLNYLAYIAANEDYSQLEMFY